MQTVLVAGATGGVGQLAMAQLLQQGYTPRALTRSPEKAAQLFGDRAEIAVGDLRQPDTLPAAVAGTDAVVCCAGTTAFPSSRWEVHPPDNPLAAAAYWGQIYLDEEFRQEQAQNAPADMDAKGAINLIWAAVAASTVQQFVLVSSCGVERQTQFPYSVLNAFGVLKAKAQAESALRTSGLTYTIVRPGRLIDGPYTSYDLNTLMRATTEGKQGVQVGRGDRLTGQTSRIDVAAACVASLRHPAAQNKTFELINSGPRPNSIDWANLFTQI